MSTDSLESVRRSNGSRSPRKSLFRRLFGSRSSGEDREPWYAGLRDPPNDDHRQTSRKLKRSKSVIGSVRAKLHNSVGRTRRKTFDNPRTIHESRGRQPFIHPGFNVYEFNTHTGRPDGSPPLVRTGHFDLSELYRQPATPVAQVYTADEIKRLVDADLGEFESTANMGNKFSKASKAQAGNDESPDVADMLRDPSEAVESPNTSSRNSWIEVNNRPNPSTEVTVARTRTNEGMSDYQHLAEYMLDPVPYIETKLVVRDRESVPHPSIPPVTAVSAPVPVSCDPPTPAPNIKSHALSYDETADPCVPRMFPARTRAAVDSGYASKEQPEDAPDVACGTVIEGHMDDFMDPDKQRLTNPNVKPDDLNRSSHVSKDSGVPRASLNAMSNHPKPAAMSCIPDSAASWGQPPTLQSSGSEEASRWSDAQRSKRDHMLRHAGVSPDRKRMSIDGTHSVPIVTTFESQGSTIRPVKWVPSAHERLRMSGSLTEAPRQEMAARAAPPATFNQWSRLDTAAAREATMSSVPHAQPTWVTNYGQLETTLPQQQAETPPGLYTEDIFAKNIASPYMSTLGYPFSGPNGDQQETTPARQQSEFDWAAAFAMYNREGYIPAWPPIKSNVSDEQSTWASNDGRRETTRSQQQSSILPHDDQAVTAEDNGHYVRGRAGVPPRASIQNNIPDQDSIRGSPPKRTASDDWLDEYARKQNQAHMDADKFWTPERRAGFEHQLETGEVHPKTGIPLCFYDGLSDAERTSLDTAENSMEYSKGKAHAKETSLD